MGGPCNIDGERPQCTNNFDNRKAFQFEGQEWKCVEAAFQAMKYRSKEKREQIRALNDGFAAAGAGQERLPIRPDWDAVRIHIMYRASRVRYHQHPELQKELLKTGDKEIKHNDANGFWAEWNAKIQTRIREELKPESERNQLLLDALVKEFDEECQEYCDELELKMEPLPGEAEMAEIPDYVPCKFCDGTLIAAGAGQEEQVGLAAEAGYRS